MKSKATRRFWQAFANLPLHARMLAQRCYQTWKRNHQHPSLPFKKLKGGPNHFSVRIGNHDRAIGRIADDTVEWVWIGTHEDYNKLIR